jgi:hypothetical protein
MGKTHGAALQVVSQAVEAMEKAGTAFGVSVSGVQVVETDIWDDPPYAQVTISLRVLLLDQPEHIVVRGGVA